MVGSTVDCRRDDLDSAHNSPPAGINSSHQRALLFGLSFRTGMGVSVGALGLVGAACAQVGMVTS